MKIDGLDHLMLTVHDVGRICAFYETVLHMKVITFGEDRKALKFGRQKINLNPFGREYEPKAGAPTPGSAEICLLTKTPLADWIAHIEGCGVELVLPPHPRTGASGPLESICLRDPDGNLIEISNAVK